MAAFFLCRLRWICSTFSALYFSSATAYTFVLAIIVVFFFFFDCGSCCIKYSGIDSASWSIESRRFFLPVPALCAGRTLPRALALFDFRLDFGSSSSSSFSRRRRRPVVVVEQDETFHRDGRFFTSCDGALFGAGGGAARSGDEPEALKKRSA